MIHGLWRSLVARSSGGRKVVSSNLASPTKPTIERDKFNETRYGRCTALSDPDKNDSL